MFKAQACRELQAALGEGWRVTPVSGCRAVRALFSRGQTGATIQLQASPYWLMGVLPQQFARRWSTGEPPRWTYAVDVTGHGCCLKMITEVECASV
jgi:hypothetical protein